jgi:hypothetical protein
MNFDGNVPRCNFALYCFYCPSALKKLFTFLLLNSCSLEFWQFYFVLWLIFSVYLSNPIFCSVPRETLSVGSVQAQDGYWENRCHRVTKGLYITWMQSDTLVCFEGYHIVKETSCQALSMAFAVRATPVIVGSPAQIQKAPHPSCLALSLRRRRGWSICSGAGKWRCFRGFSELVKGLAKARPVKFTAWSNVVASRIRIQN